MATWDAYSRAWREWKLLLAEVGGLESGVDLSSVVLYFIVHTFVRGASALAVDHKLMGLVFWFKLQGIGDATKSFMVLQAMKGYRKRV